MGGKVQQCVDVCWFWYVELDGCFDVVCVCFVQLVEEGLWVEVELGDDQCCYVVCFDIGDFVFEYLLVLVVCYVWMVFWMFVDVDCLDVCVFECVGGDQCGIVGEVVLWFVGIVGDDEVVLYFCFVYCCIQVVFEFGLVGDVVCGEVWYWFEVQGLYCDCCFDLCVGVFVWQEGYCDWCVGGD